MLFSFPVCTTERYRACAQWNIDYRPAGHALFVGTADKGRRGPPLVAFSLVNRLVVCVNHAVVARLIALGTALSTTLCALSAGLLIQLLGYRV